MRLQKGPPRRVALSITTTQLREGLTAGFEDGQDEHGVVAQTCAAGLATDAQGVVHGNFAVHVLEGPLCVFPHAKAYLRLEPGAAHASAGDGGIGFVYGVHLWQHVCDNDGGVEAGVKGGHSLDKLGEAVVAVLHSFVGIEHLLDCRGDGEAEVSGGGAIESIELFEFAQSVAEAVEEGAGVVFGNAGTGGGVVDGDEVANTVLEPLIGEVQLGDGGAIFAGVAGAKDAASKAFIVGGFDDIFAAGLLGAKCNHVNKASGGGFLLALDKLKIVFKVEHVVYLIDAEVDGVVEFALLHPTLAKAELVCDHICAPVGVFMHICAANLRKLPVDAFGGSIREDGGEGLDAGVELLPFVLPFLRVFDTRHLYDCFC